MLFHTSRWKYFFGYLLVVALFLAGFSAFERNLVALSIICFVFSIIFLVVFELLVWLKRLSVGDKDVVLSEGILSKRVIKVHYGGISDVSVDQTFVQRLFGFGDVHINTGGSDVKEIVVIGFSKPFKIEKLVSDKVHSFKVIRQGQK